MINILIIFQGLQKKKKINILSFGFSNKADARLVSNVLYKNYNDLHFKVLNESIYLKVKNINPLIISNILSTLLTLNVLDLDLTKNS